MASNIDVVVVNGYGLGEYCNVKKIPVVGETATLKRVRAKVPTFPWLLQN